MMDIELADLLQRADLDELVREIDRRCNRHEYGQVLALRDGCRDTSEQLGRQLWGPAQYAEYRLALEAPGPLAASVVVPGAGRFALGPLTEVLAQHHRFDEVADHLDASVLPVVAQERALRGEDLSGDVRAGADDVGVPAVLQPWEPAYPLPTYRPAERHEPGPPLEGAGPPRGRPRDAVPTPTAGAPAEVVDAEARPGLAEALRDLVAPWVDHSRGEVRLAVRRGPVDRALAALRRDPGSLVALRLPQALARMAWAGASGGAHGRRRGGAAGRSAAWWVAHVATRVPFPAEPDELEYHLEELTWYAFGDHDGRIGWQLCLAVAGDGWAAAVDAHDHDEDDHAP
jgi:hypothetical protein